MGPRRLAPRGRGDRAVAKLAAAVRVGVRECINNGFFYQPATPTECASAQTQHAHTHQPSCDCNRRAAEPRRVRPSRASSSAKAKKPGERGKAESATRRGGDAAAVVVVDALRALGVDHLRVLRELERHHAVARGLERDRLAPTPACVSGNRVGAEAARASGARGECGRRRKQRVGVGFECGSALALARDERHEVGRERVELAVGACTARNGMVSTGASRAV